MELRSTSKKGVNLRFGTAVKRLRNQLGISQETLAERAGLDRTYIGHVERGARNVSLSTIDKLARALEVSIATLLSGPGEQFRSGTGLRFGLPSEEDVDILMVEDNQRDVELTLRAFKRAEIRNSIHVVSDGAEALDYLFCSGRFAERRMEDRPRLVLLDLNLPKIGGLEVLRRIKADHRTRRIPVVVLTINQNRLTIAEAIEAGASAYIAKPVGLLNLSEVMPRLRLKWALVQPLSSRHP